MFETSVYEYLLLCYMSSYRESDYLKALSAEKKIQFNSRCEKLRELGWKPLKTSEEFQISHHGYFGVAYYKIDKTKDEAEVVIAHRGTCFDKDENILADLEIAQQQLPRILPAAVFKYMQEIFGNDYYASVAPNNCYIESCPITKISHTGFSLGGFIAGASAALSKTPMHAVTFDAPGISGAVRFDAASQSRLHNYVTEPNLVNTCNTHVGKVSQFSHFASEQFQIIDGKPKDATVDFDFEFNDFGFAIDSTNEALAVKRDRKLDGATKAIREAVITMRSHSLETLIKLHEDRTVSSEHRPVFLWPAAKNDMVYGNVPITGNLVTLGWDGFWAGLASTLAIGAQFVKSAYSFRLWNLTKRLNNLGQHEGLIGVRHKRSNQIFYTEAEFAQFRLASSIPKPTLPLQVPIGVIPEAKAVTDKTQTKKSAPSSLHSFQLT